MTEAASVSAVELELSHAESAFQAALLLRDAALYNDALNRLYYALFHTVSALLLTAGIEPRRHRALPGLLGTHFGASLGPGELATVARAATWRDLADYERTWHADQAVVGGAFAEIEPLLTRVRELIRVAQGSPSEPQRDAEG